jgi:transposase InsO family protein
MRTTNCDTWDRHTSEIRTIKEEEIWPNLWENLSEARRAMEAYVTYYNQERLHSSLDYRTPSEVAAAFITRAAA